MASLLIVCLMSEMDYTTHILKQLLGQLIDKSLVRQHSKMLLRRTDSVGEKLLTNWLAICLYRHIKVIGTIRKVAGSTVYIHILTPPLSRITLVLLCTGCPAR